MVNQFGEEFTGQVMQGTMHKGEKIIWIKLHEGNKQFPIEWSKSEAMERKKVLVRWREHEEREERETLAVQAEREWRQKWDQHEQRECYKYGPRPMAMRYRTYAMSKPVLRSHMGWR